MLTGTTALPQTPNAHRTPSSVKEADAAFRSGYEAANAGDLEKARRSFAEVVRLEPKIPEGHAALGSVLLSLGRPSEAAEELKRGLALKPSDANMKMNLALAEVRAGRSGEALPLLKEVSGEISASGNALPPEVEIAYAQALTEAGQRPAALDRLRAAVAAAPDNAALHDGLGSLLAQEEQWPAAQLEFARAVELDPKLAAARLHLG
ncbi:MAG TPA: tetratricopeptide repeat protein, partial [Acidobacteriaceae bacterium]|nr:tetratricopeptide repeat protein [Acidobacteriaceae bacterium]